ncbi:hypothetical protein BTM25_19920 [Actinomadura rubteroloni]|uniref:Integral membrane protein n=1 Tax=Actinomadura rubteroloni TaxID=1926885 RepID=A0A2P4URB4_9ACTN|nr:DUF6113 family protein [Actinomadura rubteroloni]POM27576.1 hypothetical protein BTM25_19920 [Actinomadura rubteroloni]
MRIDDEAPAAPRRGDRPLDAMVTGAAYAVLALLGAVVGVFGAAVQLWPFTPAVAPALLAAAAVFAVAYLAGRGMGSRAGAIVPGTAWLVVTLVLSAQRSEGDLLILGNAAGYVYMAAGVLAVVAAPLLVPAKHPSGSWLTRR